MAISKFLAPLNGRINVQQEQPYVDDIFDPLFNTEVRNYYNSLYGPIGGIGAGYASMLENALTGRKGILGPGMGILSTFGRSMDKADDFILGGLTEGVNALGQVTGGLNEAPRNPFERIFADDYDYQGTKLLAAAGNAMARMAGTNTPLTEADFNTLGDKISGLSLDLATDPGIMGGQLARLNPNTPVGQVGHFLDEYDNIMANVAGNMAFPGGKALLHGGIKKIQDVNKGLGAFTTGTIKDSHLRQSAQETLRQMADDYVKKYNIGPDHPEWKDYESLIKDMEPDFKMSDIINQETLAKPAKTGADMLGEIPTGRDKILRDIINDSLDELKKKYHLAKDADVDDVLKYLSSVKDEDRLLPYLNQMRKTFRMTSTGRRTIVNGTEIAKPLLDEADLLYKKGWTEKRIANLENKISASQSNIVKGNEFLDRILTTRHQSAIYDATDPIIPTVRNALQHNVEEINRYSTEPLLTLIDKTENGKVTLGYMLNAGKEVADKTGKKVFVPNKTWIKDFKKISKKDLDLMDTIWKFGDSTIKFTPEEQEVLNYFSKLDNASKRYSNWLGFERGSKPHLRMLMGNGPDASRAAMNYYKDLGLNKEQADLLLAEIQNANNRLVKRGAFGTIDIANSYLGPLKNSPYKYSYDLRAIAASTFTDSYMDNVNVQTMVSLMDNPMFTLRNRFDSPKYVKDALVGEGNQNLTLATLKFDENNQIIGFKRYDKYSDAEIEKAFEDPNCILCPEDIVSSLEHAFLNNKHIPPRGIQVVSQLYKSSILNNFGFPVGNFGDAFTKQSIEIGRHFGDTAPEAIVNTAESMRDVLQLNDLFDQYVMKDLNAFLDTPAAKKHPFFKKYAANKIALNSGTVFNNPELTRMFERYVDEVMPSGSSRNLAIFYMDLCGDIDINIGKYKDVTSHVRFNKDLEEMNSMFANNPYAEDSWTMKVLYGDKNSEHPIGIINNPLSRLTLGVSENYIEPMARGGTYLNYLKHKGYTMKDILEIVGFKGHVDEKTAEEFHTACQEAVNAMYATNFNYESTSKFQKVFAKFVPFPTFYLKNIAFWLDVFDKNPQIIDNTLDIHQGLWSGKDTKDEFVAQAKGRGAIPIGQQNKHLTGIVKPTPYNSMFGAFGAINDPTEDIAFRTNPLMRPITRHLQKPEDVKYRPYNTQQFQKNIKQGDKEFSDLAYMFHQLNPYDRYINAYLRTPGKVATNSYQASDFLPSLFQPDFGKK